MKLVTVCNKEHPGLQLWKDTARAQGYDAHVLMDTSLEIGHESGKFGNKFIKLRSFLEPLGQELVLVTDAFDVAFIESATSMETRLRILPGELLFSGELYENPDQGYPFHDGRLPFLNAGVYAGAASDILFYLRPFFALSSKEQIGIDDQRYWIQQHFLHPSIRVDVDGEFFASLLGVKDMTGIRAGVYHFQGFYKDLRVLEFTPFWKVAKAIHKPHTPLTSMLELLLTGVFYLVPPLKTMPRIYSIALLIGVLYLICKGYIFGF